MSTAPSRVQAVPHPDGSVERRAATDKNKSNRESTAVATAKLLLRGVRDSADAFGPLKAVAGSLCFILDNYEVRLSQKYTVRDAYTSPPAYEDKQRGNGIVSIPGRRAC